MGLFSLALNSARDLLMVQLEALYDGEKRLADALPAMLRAARAPELQLALSIHQEQTQRHIARLEEVFGRLGS
ncbi:MAG TPA: DUF892 family protein, partial [Planctomycetaceae bacterium]|nr:DUF892 family protein [Planctomycetaceae bacterium]